MYKVQLSLRNKTMGPRMVISEKQIMLLIRIANAYCSVVRRFGEYKTDVEEVQNLLATINDQQSEELKVIE